MNNFAILRRSWGRIFTVVLLIFFWSISGFADETLPPSVVEKANQRSAESDKEKEENARAVEIRIKEATEEATIAAKEVNEASSEIASGEGKKESGISEVKTYVVPVHGAITGTTEFIMRRAIKSAIEENIDTVILDIDTPGGALDVTLEIMEMLDRFEGDTIAYVNEEAISAGAIISVSADYIYLHKKGVIGAAAAVQMTGSEIPETMRQKVNSFMDAKIRTVSAEEEHPYRAKVVKKMMDADYELVIEGEVYLGEGSLLTLTASEAMKEYGEPPTPLFGDGIAESVDELLEMQYGDVKFVKTDFEITWSEKFASFMDGIKFLLIVLGIVFLYLEAQTPSFGVFGISGVVLIGIVILSGFAAGLAGHEALLLFLVGTIFIAVEIFVLPGTIIFAFLGVMLIVTSLAWSMTDIWPTSTGGFDIDTAKLMWSVTKTVFAFLTALIVILILWKILNVTGLADRMVMSDKSASPSLVTVGGGSIEEGQNKLPDIGSKGKAVGSLHPLGQVEVDGHIYEASVSVGVLERGEPIVVVGYKQFSLLVRKDENPE